MATALLADRSVVQVSGEEARSFLDRLVTCGMDRVALGQARFGALLSPQGKILADFITIQADEAGQIFFLDCPMPCVAELIRRLSMYKLRAKVAVTELADAAVLAGWGGAVPPADAVSVEDPRLPALGWRAVLRPSSRPGDGAVQGGEAYEAHRVALGIPSSGRDFALGETFAHEALMDQLAGVDFDKGCYVGQEIVSRMQHRGTARTRIVSVLWERGAGISPGAEIVAGDRNLGRMGSVSGNCGLAMIRLDRTADALAGGASIPAGGVPLRFDKPGWVRFPYPDEMMAPAV